MPEKARDYDALPFRADSRVNKMILEAGTRAAGPTLVLSDAAGLVASNSPGFQIPLRPHSYSSFGRIHHEELCDRTAETPLQDAAKIQFSGLLPQRIFPPGWSTAVCRWPHRYFRRSDRQA